MTYPSFFTEKPAAVYVPFRQHLSQYGREDEWIHTRKVLAVRASVDPLTLVRPIQDAVAHVDRDQAAHDFMTMEQRVASSPSVTNSRFFASLFTAFGTLAILLAMVGVYGVMSWVVGQRTTEFGIRMALGARAARRRGDVAGAIAAGRSCIGVLHRRRRRLRSQPRAQQHVLADDRADPMVLVGDCRADARRCAGGGVGARCTASRGSIRKPRCDRGELNQIRKKIFLRYIQ